MDTLGHRLKDFESVNLTCSCHLAFFTNKPDITLDVCTLWFWFEPDSSFLLDLLEFSRYHLMKQTKNMNKTQKKSVAGFKQRLTSMILIIDLQQLVH